MIDMDIVVVGAGAAGIAAARRLTEHKLRVVVLEARGRAGGRAWTRYDAAAGFAIDLGCGWLHSADENEWVGIAGALGIAIDDTPPPWSRPAMEAGFTLADQVAFRDALGRFYAALDQIAAIEPDRAAADLLPPGGRWNPLINAVSTYVNGTELRNVSVRDWRRYHDTEINHRVVAGYGALMEAYGAGLDVRFDCPVSLIDHSGQNVRLATPRGDLTADAAIITVPTEVIAAQALRFKPALPDKIAAAAALPLGLADKVFLRLAGPDDVPAQTRLYGANDRTETGSYHVRPLGAPVIEGYFGGAFARALEDEGEGAMTDFAIAEIATHLGSAFRTRLTPIVETAWGHDPFARGSYSYARIGKADQRAVLARPVDKRLYFAGEACSASDFTTAHGAYRSGLAAADGLLQAWRRR